VAVSPLIRGSAVKGPLAAMLASMTTTGRRGDREDLPRPRLRVVGGARRRRPARW
jgi:hypothetical protein